MKEEVKTENKQQIEKTPQNEIPEVLTQNEAISVLIQAAEIAQKKGIYSFEESALIYKAIKTFVQK